MLLGVLALTPLTASQATAATEGALPPSQLTVETEQLASGLGTVTAIASPDDGSNRLFLTEKAGTVRVYQLGEGLEQGVYLDMRDRVDTSGFERGLLGIAASPDFAETHTLFVAYTSNPDGAVTLSRFRLDSADQSEVPASSEEVLLTQEHSQYANHNGGQLAFGPDGYLYWGIGDGGGSGDPLRSGQDLSTLLGKILRIDAMKECGDKPYCVPEDNPFVDRQGARPEIWAYGLRNPWRFSFDAANGSLWIGDVGQDAYEEVNRLAAEQGGANLGWSCREGPEVFNEDQCDESANYVDPVFYYSQEGDGGCSVTGGFVYRGEQFADIAAGTYVAADWCNGKAWGVQRTDDGSYESARIGRLPTGLTTFGVDSQNELYAATDGGGLYRVMFSSEGSAAGAA